MIELKNIHKTYQWQQQSYQALEDINLTIQVGEIVGIVGESGAGKSTLLRTVNLLEKPTRGQVFVNQVELTALSAEDLRKVRRKIGMIFQHFNLLQARTVFENIALPLELIGTATREVKQTVSTLLDLVGLQEFAHRYPAQLSGGQKQRVAIARALATQPTVLLCDEATSALDPKATASILNLLQQINQQLGVTILLITHEMDVIKRICHRAGVLEKGKLIEHGSIVDIFARPKAEITKQLVHKTLGAMPLPAIVKNSLPQPHDTVTRLVRFTFIGNDSSQPLLSTLIQKFNLTINILQANIETIQSATIGFTLCQLIGQEAAITQALAYIQPAVIAEVLNDV